jgi:hypothetical protein
MIAEQIPILLAFGVPMVIIAVVALVYLVDFNSGDK